MLKTNQYLLAIVALAGLNHLAIAQDNAEDLAKKLANPIASLTSVPFQFNYDENMGSDDTGDRVLLNFQPVIPVSLSDDWNLISRTIIPVITQDNVLGDGSSQSGLGDTIQSAFFSPKALTASGWTWGIGPVFLLPTGTDDLLGTDQWGAGPTAVALKQSGPWTYGVLANHVWSETGDRVNQQAINSSFMQPFWSYTTKEAVTYTLNTESTYNWASDSDEWAVPINMMVAKVLKVGEQMLSVRGGARYWAESTDSGPEGWGLRMEFVLLYPK